jgi:hypothetical protein
MSRQARTLVILAAMGLLALVALGAMARRYSRLVEGGARGVRPALERPAPASGTAPEAGR